MASTLTQTLRARPKPLPVAPVGPQPRPRTYLPPIRARNTLNAQAPYIPVPGSPPLRPLPKQIIPKFVPPYQPPHFNLFRDTLERQMMQGGAPGSLPLQYQLPSVVNMQPGMIAAYQPQFSPSTNEVNNFNWGNAYGGYPSGAPITLLGHRPYGIGNWDPNRTFQPNYGV